MIWVGSWGSLRRFGGPGGAEVNQGEFERIGRVPEEAREDLECFGEGLWGSQEASGVPRGSGDILGGFGGGQKGLGRLCGVPGRSEGSGRGLRGAGEDLEYSGGSPGET